MSTADWDLWASSVLLRIGAPVNEINADTIWAWSNAESGADVMRWNNPLNTTQDWPGAVNMNSVGVKRYLTVQDGIGATVVTLTNGFYPVILANFRASVPRAQWGNACPNLGVWGTGCGWLQGIYGPVPGNLGGDMTPEEHEDLIALSWRLAWALGSPFPTGDPNIDKYAIAGATSLPTLKTEIDTLKQDVADLKSTVARIKAAL
jgi:hypothetical protein